MKATANIMVLLVEDNMDIAATVSDYLTIEGVECDHAYDGETAYQMALTGEYDVILLDLMLPFRDGISICKALRDEGIDTPVLMLTARDTLDDKKGSMPVQMTIWSNRSSLKSFFCARACYPADAVAR